MPANLFIEKIEVFATLFVAFSAGVYYLGNEKPERFERLKRVIVCLFSVVSGILLLGILYYLGWVEWLIPKPEQPETAKSMINFFISVMIFMTVIQTTFFILEYIIRPNYLNRPRAAAR